jgi:transposase
LKIDNIDVEAAIKNVQALLETDKSLTPALKAALDMLLLLVTLLINQKGLNSKNSSIPPSSDPNRKKVSKAKSARKPGGQKGSKGTTLSKVDNPDEVIDLLIDRRTLPKGINFKAAGYEIRQEIDVTISRFVTEYRAEVLEDSQGHRFTATFPEALKRPVQYGNNIKAHSVYMSQFQLVPVDRVRDHFADQMGVPVSAGSICNFNRQAYNGLGRFEGWAKQQLIASPVMHADETGINIGGKRHWLHNVSSTSLTLLYPHEKRGREAMDMFGVIPSFQGVLCHDHWKPYYLYDCLHSLCNAHHLRELERAFEQDQQQWAKAVQTCLLDINAAVDDSGGALNVEDAKRWREYYRKLLADAEHECPPPVPTPNKRGRVKRSKARNLLERLVNYEVDVLRFMTEEHVPFTNNQGENDLRMTKVQQKISGCFRSMDGAKTFCRIRSYLSTCRKQGLTASKALSYLFDGKDPEFMR